MGRIFRAQCQHLTPRTLENWLEGNAGVEPTQGGFLLHYLDKLVYPDISSTILTITAVIICALNLAFYGRQIWIARVRQPAP